MTQKIIITRMTKDGVEGRIETRIETVTEYIKKNRFISFLSVIQAHNFADEIGAEFDNQILE